MNSEIIGIVLQLAVVIALSLPLGKYIAKVYKGEKSLLDFLGPLERRIYKLCSIDADEQMDWKKFLRTLLVLNAFWFVWGLVILIAQGILPLNPDGNGGQSLHRAFNTCVSFLVNCNLQHYSGETGLTYCSQIFVVMLFQFLAAATGLAAFAAVLKGMSEKTTRSLGNFWVYLVRSLTRILVPAAMVLAVLLILGGTPMTLVGKRTLTTIEGESQTISQGPVAAVVAIKQLGTNGGGFFGANSAHPLENPTLFTNTIECMAIMLIPMALVWAVGFYLRKKKFALSVFAVMLTAFAIGLCVSVHQEASGNHTLAEMGISQPSGSMEGKEVRTGPEYTAFWAMATTATSNGSVNGMQDSLTPLSGMMAMLNMQINCWFGGLGAGFMNYYLFIIISVFISGLMVGRTPEFLGKKIEAHEMKIATLVVLLHPFLILCGTALAAHLAAGKPSLAGAWLGNPSFHGLSEMLYEFTSSAANNGSGFEGLGDNTPFWNISTGIVLLLGRYLPIIGQVAIAGSLAQKRYVPSGTGTLQTDTATFAVMTLCVIVIVAALSFFPALSLGPLSEYLTIRQL